MLPNPISAQANTPRMNASTPAAPAGTRRLMYRSGTNAPSSTVSSLRVARMPSTSQVSTTVKPSPSRGRNPCTIIGCAGSLVSMPWMPRSVQTGVRLPKCLRP